MGVTSTEVQLFYTAILNVLSFIMATVGARFTDRLGRRPVLLIGTSLFVVWWVIITVLTALYGADSEYQRNIKQSHGESNKPHEVNLPGARATIAFIYLFGITYSFAYTPLQALYPVECLAYETRAKGMGMYNFFVNIAAFFNTYAIPVVWERITWKFYFVFIAWDVFEVVFIYFL